MNFYKRFLGDYARDTAHLSLVEHGAYGVLLDTYYATGRSLPPSKDELYRIARAMSAPERKAVDRVADEFFPVNGDGTRHNKRADAELHREQEYAESQRKRAGKRWGHAEDMPPDMPLHMPVHIPDEYPNDASHSHSHRKEKTKATSLTLPDWVPAEAWTAWLEVRTRIKAPNTSSALRLALRALEQLRADGHDLKAVLEEATLRGWRKPYPPKGGKSVDPTEGAT